MFLFLLVIGLAFGEGPIVHNGPVPGGVASTIEFEEDLRIGPESGEEYHLWTGNTVSVEVTSAGHMLVIDCEGNRVLVFDEQGRFLRQIGQKGNGPGEFQALNYFQILGDGSAVAFQRGPGINDFDYFNQGLKFSKHIKKSNGLNLQSALFTPNGESLFGASLKFDPPYLRAVTGFFDVDRKLKYQLSELEMPAFDRSKSQDANWWATFLGGWFRLATEGIGVAAFAADGTIYSAVTSSYEVTRWSPKMEKELVFRRDFKPKIQTEEEVMAFTEPVRDQLLGLVPSMYRQISESAIKKAIVLADFPARKNPIFGLIAMENGGLLVIHDYSPSSRKVRADIFDRKGLFRGRTDLPPIRVSLFAGFFGSSARMCFKNGFAYAIVYNQENEAELVRYRYRIKRLKL